MSILFRVDASEAIGTGHVMRCLGLAAELERLGETPVFIARSMPPHLVKRIRERNYGLEMLSPTYSQNERVMHHAAWLTASWQQDVDETLKYATAYNASWVVIDHYGIDLPWQQKAKAGGLKVAVLDDLADRPHGADLLVDPSLNAAPHGRYADLSPKHAQRLLGPRYAILRPEFSEPRPAYDQASLRYLIAFGGVDAAGMTMIAIEALSSLSAEADVNVIVGGQNGALTEIRIRTEALGWTVHVDSSAVGDLMARSDIAIGAGGHMLWERAAMRLPTVAIIVAENQREQVNEAAKQNLVMPLDAETVTADSLALAVTRLASDDALRRAMADACAWAVDGKGARRIARRLAADGITMRTANASDRTKILEWRNDERVRRFSRDSNIIAASAHDAWLQTVLSAPDRQLLIGEDSGEPVGVVRFDQDGNRAEVSIYLTPSRLGSGLGANLLLAAEQWLAFTHPDIHVIDAEVLDANAASAELFLSTGYTPTSSGQYEKRMGR
ncbi:MAG: UDP-2,4-diacetamido-2,4,6-trideoxy-beta-L-altropyranose hydrolase [Alphaproteobacteria bacterium]